MLPFLTGSSNKLFGGKYLQTKSIIHFTKKLDTKLPTTPNC